MNILFVGDADNRARIAGLLRKMGHQLTECDDVEEALLSYLHRNFSMVVSDIKIPGITGLDLLRHITAATGKQTTDVVLLAEPGEIQTAIEALQAGAYAYLRKPVNTVELAAVTVRIAEHQALLKENRVLAQQSTVVPTAESSPLQHPMPFLAGMDSKVGFFSDEMRRIVRQARKYHEERSIPVLIEGETGTGKEVLARIVHHGNEGSSDPLVDVNCAALTPSLFESELFGYEAGAFTGGLTKGQKGKLDLAQGGSMLLDEVGEIPLDLQGKLLRVLQEKEFYRVGGLKKIKTDVRIICATNSNLGLRVEQGKFRKDLYYRLKVGHFFIPPLRRRKSDILPLTEMFLRLFAAPKGRRFCRISPGAAEILLAYDWPGNVRELRNTMELVVFMHDDAELKPLHLVGMLNGTASSPVTPDATDSVLHPDAFVLPPDGFDLENYMDCIVRKALEMWRGNKTAAARYLGISRRSLYSRLDRKKVGTT